MVAFPIAALPPLASAAEPDAKLITLHRALLAQSATMRRIENEPVSPGITPESEAHDARLSDACDLEQELMEDIGGIPAATPAGLRAKSDCLRIALLRSVVIGRGHTIDDLDLEGPRR